MVLHFYILCRTEGQSSEGQMTQQTYKVWGHHLLCFLWEIMLIFDFMSKTH